MGKVRDGDLALCFSNYRNLIGYVYLSNNAVRIVRQSGKARTYTRAECAVIGRIRKVIKPAKPDASQPFTDEQAAQLAELRHELARLERDPQNAVRRSELLRQVKKLERAADLNAGNK
jgi:hypothetical protein